MLIYQGKKFIQGRGYFPRARPRKILAWWIDSGLLLKKNLPLGEQLSFLRVNLGKGLKNPETHFFHSEP